MFTNTNYLSHQIFITTDASRPVLMYKISLGQLRHEKTTAAKTGFVILKTFSIL